MRRRLSCFEKRLLLREEHFIRKKDFYKEKIVLLEKESSIKRRKSYFEKRLLLREENLILKRLL